LVRRQHLTAALTDLRSAVSQTPLASSIPTVWKGIIERGIDHGEGV